MKLVCIDDLQFFGDGVKELTWGKEYQIISHYDSPSGKRYYNISNDKGVGNDYLSDRFVTREEFRELQINKIFYNQEDNELKFILFGNNIE